MKKNNYKDIKYINDIKAYIYDNYVIAYDLEYDPKEKNGCNFADFKDVEKVAEAKEKLKQEQKETKQENLQDYKKVVNDLQIKKKDKILYNNKIYEVVYVKFDSTLAIREKITDGIYNYLYNVNPLKVKKL